MTPSDPRFETKPSAAARREQMSSLADGEIEGSEQRLAEAMAVWRHDADARQTWHRYHLIGDVMRSEDLAQQPAHDLAFLNRLRERLAAEPAPVAEALPTAASQVPPQMAPYIAPEMAPQKAAAVLALPRRVWGGPWRAGAALAASVAAATVVLLVSRPSPPLADAGAPLVASHRDAGAAPLSPVVNTAGVLRDPRLDEFLRLHQMARGGLPVSAPGGTLQRADLQLPVGSGR